MNGPDELSLGGKGGWKECFLFNPTFNHWIWGQWRLLQPPRAWFHVASPALFCQPHKEAPPPELHTRFASQASLRWNSQYRGLVTAPPSLCHQHRPILHGPLFLDGSIIPWKALLWFPDSCIFRVLKGHATQCNYFYRYYFSWENYDSIKELKGARWFTETWNYKYSGTTVKGNLSVTHISSFPF